jgi:hypothetical protein
MSSPTFGFDHHDQGLQRVGPALKRAPKQAIGFPIRAVIDTEWVDGEATQAFVHPDRIEMKWEGGIKLVLSKMFIGASLTIRHFGFG